MLNPIQQYILDQITKGRKLQQVNYKHYSRIQFKDSGEVVNIKIIQALRKKGYNIEFELVTQ